MKFYLLNYVYEDWNKDQNLSTIRHAQFTESVLQRKRGLKPPRLHDTTCCETSCQRVWQPVKCLYTRYNRLSMTVFFIFLPTTETLLIWTVVPGHCLVAVSRRGGPWIHSLTRANPSALEMSIAHIIKRYTNVLLRDLLTCLLHLGQSINRL